MTEVNQQTSNWNVPNVLTTLRIVLVPFYKLGGKWGVFGVLCFGALALVGIGVLKHKYGSKSPMST